MTHTPQQSPVDTDHLRDYSALRRSTTDRKIAGVAGGLGRHLNIDPTIVRVVLVVLCFFGGAGFLLYAAGWLLVPEEGRQEALIATSPSTRNAVLLVVGVVAALLLVGDSWGGFGFPWPLVLIGVGVLVYLALRDRPATATAPQQPTQQPDRQPTQYPDPHWDQPPHEHPGAVEDEDVDHTAVFGAPPPWTAPPGPAYPPPQPPAPRRSGPRLFWIALALIAIGVGTLGMFDLSGWPVVTAAYPALALTIVALLLLLGAWYGRAGGLIALGVVTSLLLAAVSIGDPGFEGTRGATYTPTSADQVDARYDVPAGVIDLDLTQVRDLENLDGRSIEVRANAGELRVILPEGVDAEVDAEVTGVGEADVAGQVSNGPNVSLTRSIDGGADAPEIDLDLHLIVGRIEVTR